jgi:hypothetical protein
MARSEGDEGCFCTNLSPIVERKTVSDVRLLLALPEGEAVKRLHNENCAELLGI